MPAFSIGVVACNGWYKLGLVKVNTGVFKHFINRLNGFRGHHGRCPNLINLQYCRRVAGTECRDPGAQVLFIVPLIDRNDFVIRIGPVETLRQ